MKTVKEKQILMAAVESVPAAFRAITGNGVNVLAMGAFYVTPELGKQCADAFLYNDFGSGWEWWPDFDKFHQIAIDELNAFNYEEYKANGFKVKHLGDCHCELYDRPEGFSSVPLMCKRGGVSSFPVRFPRLPKSRKKLSVPPLRQCGNMV